MQDPTSSPTEYDATSEPPTVRWYAPLVASPVLTLACMAVFVGLGVAASVLIPAQYLARGKIILPNSSKGGSALAGLASSVGLGGVDSGSLPMFAAILKSERMLSDVARRTGVPRKKLRKDLGVRDDPKANTIEIYATAPTKNGALRVVKSSLVALDEIADRVNLPVRENRTKSLQNTLANRQQALTRSEGALKGFLASAKTLPGGSVDLSPANGLDTAASSSDGPNGIQSAGAGLGYKQQVSSLEIQLRKLDRSMEAIHTAARAQETAAPLDLPPVQLWADKIAGAQARLAELRPRYQEGSPEIREAEAALAGIQAQRKRDIDKYLASVQASLTGPAQSLSVLRAGVESQIADVKRYADAMPGETIRYLRLLRDVKTNEQIVGQIRLQVEKSKLDQTDDPNTWSVLDAPEIDDEYDSTKAKRNIGLGILLGIASAYALGSARLARKGG